MILSAPRSGATVSPRILPSAHPRRTAHGSQNSTAGPGTALARPKMAGTSSTSGLGSVPAYGGDAAATLRARPRRTLVVNAAPGVVEAAPRGHGLALVGGEGAARRLAGALRQPDTTRCRRRAGASLARQQAGPEGSSKQPRRGGAGHPSSTSRSSSTTFNAYGFMWTRARAATPGRATAARRWRGSSASSATPRAEARGGSVFSQAPIESKLEEQRKRLRLDASYQPIPHKGEPPPSRRRRSRRRRRPTSGRRATPRRARR